MNVVNIGKCKGCDKMSSLDEGVCSHCLTDSDKGKQWAETSAKIRDNPDLAIIVFKRIRTTKGKRMFLLLYGESLRQHGYDTKFIEKLAETK